MTSLKLDRRKRPKRFSELYGQAVATKFLSRVCESGEARHTILQGRTGCGKTTTARIYGRALNCMDLQHGGEPCNTCDHCTMQLAGTFPDYREQDAGVAGGKEALLDLLDSARTPPLMGRYRVIVIDEAQAMSGASFETLKKILEEPPPWLVLVMTTTKQHKLVLDTRDRCTTLNFRAAPQREAALTFLTDTCKSEGWEYEAGALEMIAHFAEGRYRALINRLDDLRMLGGITLENARLHFDTDHIERMPRLWVTLLTGSLPETMAALDECGSDPEETADLCRSFILWLQCQGAGQGLVSIHPSFSTFSRGLVASIADALTKRVQMNGLSLDEGFVAISKALGIAPVTSHLGLQLILRDLHNLIHVQGFDIGKLGAPAKIAGVTTKAGAAPSAKTRQLAPTYVAGADGMARMVTDPTEGFALDSAAPVHSVPVFVQPLPSQQSPAFVATTAPAGPGQFAPVGPGYIAPVATVTVGTQPAESDVPEDRVPAGTLSGEVICSFQVPPRRQSPLQGWVTGDAPTSVFHTAGSGN